MVVEVVFVAPKLTRCGACLPRPDNSGKESLIGCFATVWEAAWAYSEAYEKIGGEADSQPAHEGETQSIPAAVSGGKTGAGPPMNDDAAFPVAAGQRGTPGGLCEACFF